MHTFLKATRVFVSAAPRMYPSHADCRATDVSWQNSRSLLPETGCAYDGSAKKQRNAKIAASSVRLPLRIGPPLSRLRKRRLNHIGNVSPRPELVGNAGSHSAGPFGFSRSCTRP